MDASSRFAPSYEGAIHDIVVVGGGAAGLNLATRLGDTLGRTGRARISLVEKRRTHIWKPLLHAVAAGSLRMDEHALDYLAQAHWHHFRYRFGEMVGLDRASKRVHVARTRDEEGGEITPDRSFRYDTLVIAIGSTANDFGTPGAHRYAVPLDSPEQAVRFHRRLVNACIRAHTQPGPVRPGQLHVAIIGAGATGTELAAELHRTTRVVVGYGLDRIDPEKDVRITLIEAAERILPLLPARISRTTSNLLGRLGVEVRVNARVTEVRADGVVLADGTFVAAELIVWAAGVKAPEMLRHLDGLEANRANQLAVKATLETTRDPDVFAIGDCASCPRPGHASPVPPRAQAARQQALHLADELKRRLEGKPIRAYVYRDFGSMVSLGRYSTVGSLMGFLIGKDLFVKGWYARLIYRSLYALHEKALHGFAMVLMGAVARTISRRPQPMVKLH